jgi:hypothetical protein
MTKIVTGGAMYSFQSPFYLGHPTLRNACWDSTILQLEQERDAIETIDSNI